MSLVSVIITICNRIDYISEAIESVLSQTYNNLEIIVVDDGSTLDVKDVLEPYMNNIRYVYQSNKGLSAARNAGIKNSKGEYLAFLDDDDLFESRKLEIQVPLIENSPDIGFIYSDSYEFGGKDQTQGRLNLAVGRGQSSSEFSRLFFMDPNIRFPTVLIRRKCFEIVGLFDENLAQHEDGDMLLRIAQQWQVQFSDYPSARVRHHGDRMSQNRAGMYQAIITSSRKILEEFPDLKRDLEGYADKRMAALYYLLAHAYLEHRMIAEAREAFISCTQFSDPVKYKAYCYIFLFSLGNTLGTMFARTIGVIKGLIN